MMAPADFSANFSVTILYSDNPSLATGALTGVYASVTASSATQSITAPNYSLDLNSGSLTVAVNNAYTVQSVTGTASLVASSVTGTSYYVDQGILGASPTFTQLHTAYSSATTTAIADTGNVSIAASAFGLSGVKPSASHLAIRRSAFITSLSKSPLPIRRMQREPPDNYPTAIAPAARRVLLFTSGVRPCRSDPGCDRQGNRATYSRHDPVA